MNPRRFVFAAVALWLLAAAPAPAVEFSGENLTYEFGWKGFTAATADVKIKDAQCDGPCWDAQIEINSTGMLDAIWKVRDRIVTKAVKADFTPRRYVFYQREGKFFLDTSITLDKATGLLRSTRYRIDQQKELTPKKSETTGTFCPLSAILYLRAQPLDVGGTYKVDVFDGKRQHTVAWAVQGTEELTVPAGTFRAKKIVGKVIKSNSRDEDSKVEKVREVTIWVADDDPEHMVLRIESSTFWGAIYGQLTRK